MDKNHTKFQELLLLAFKRDEQKWVSIERNEIEKRIALFLISQYMEREYKALVNAGAIVDLLIEAEVIVVNTPEINQFNTSS